MNKTLKKIKDWFVPPYVRPIVVIDWFAERTRPGEPVKQVRPKRGPTHLRKDGLDSLIEGECFVDLDERRIFQKLNGKIVELITKEYET